MSKAQGNTMKDTGKNNSGQGKGRKKPRIQPAKAEQSEARTRRRTAGKGLALNKVLSFFYSLRFRLTLLVLIAIVPLFGLMLYTTSEQRQYAADQAKNNALALASLISKDYQGVIDSGRQLLVALARVPGVLDSPEDPATCTSFLAEVSAQYPVYSNLVVAAPNGDLVCSALPPSGTISYSDRDWFQEAMQRRNFVVGDIVLGRITKSLLLPLAYPILDSEGDVKLVVSAAVDLAWINQMSSNAQLPEGSVTMMLDHEGTVIACHPDAEGWLGKVMTEAPIVESILTQRQGTAEAGGLDGTQRLYAFVPLGSLPENEGYVVIGIPTQVAYAEVNRILAYELIGLGLVTILAFAATWLVSEASIMRRVRTMLHATRRLADGDLSARTGITQPRGELSQLAYAFDRMAESLQLREMEQKQAEEALGERESRLNIILESDPTGVMLMDKETRKITYVNHSASQMIGLPVREILGKVCHRFVCPAEKKTCPVCDLGQEVDRSNRVLIRDDGSIMPILKTVVVIKIGGKEFLLESFIDITEQKKAEEALRQAEAKYRAIFENAIDGIFQSTLEGRFLTVNPAFARMLGYASPEEMIATVTDIARQVYVESPRRADFVRLMAEQGSAFGFEFQMHRKDGGSLWVSENVRTVRDAEGRILYYEGTVEDITERKQAETKLEYQAGELRQRYAELALLYEAGLTINRELDPHLQLETLFKTAMQALQADHAEFFRYDAARGSVHFELGIGYSPEILEKLRSLVAHDGEARGLIGVVAQNRKPLNLPDVHADPRYIEIDPEIRSALWVPVARENQLLGVLGVLSTRPNAFSEQGERLLSLFANQAAVALENARLFAETSRRLKQVQALRTIDMAISGSLDLQVTFDVFLEQATRQLEVHAADILLLNPHTQTLEYIAGRGFRTNALQHTYLRLGEGYAGMAGLERKIIHISDLRNRTTDFLRSPFFSSEGFETCFCVPLIAKGQLKGVLEIFHRAPLEADQEWLDFVETLAGQAAIAMDNVTLFDDLQRSNVDLTLAYDATIEGWSHALDLRDKETEGHTQRVANLTQSMAQAMGVSDREMVHVRRGALLHDIGKMGIPDDILHKPASLDEQEWVVMRQHPLYAYGMLSPISYLRPALDIPYCHHEKWDGSGYPRGLKGEQIPLAARIFAVVDVYDALTSDRPYRKAWPRKKALEYIQQQAGQHFDPEIVSAFMGMPRLHELRNGDKISQT